MTSTNRLHIGSGRRQCTGPGDTWALADAKNFAKVVRSLEQLD